MMSEQKSRAQFLDLLKKEGFTEIRDYAQDCRRKEWLVDHMDKQSFDEYIEWTHHWEQSRRPAWASSST
ncbi:hypothetical protein DIURU_003578 [Diutina rugosa]|uniref:Uncharacterized protein n=1 Tax=Diutina rugosa TaxID=5481 RepID=A0A642ULI6_DIURU|nr:uncharacterized protein DIURU_003578 [Diutina rugosa]KAA8901208.1 hypothetical protein DIURU_003578 [Diutina rugosa]